MTPLDRFLIWATLTAFGWGAAYRFRMEALNRALIEETGQEITTHQMLRELQRWVLVGVLFEGAVLVHVIRSLPQP